MHLNPGHIKSRYSYTYKEIAQLLSVHIRTVQQWRKCGLSVIDENERPYIVLGTELKRFLKQKSTDRKHKLSDTEFFCMKCRCARESISNQISIQYTHKTVGKDQKLVNILGLCIKCGTRIYRLSTERKLEELKEIMVIPSLYDLILVENDDSSLNTDIGGIRNEQHTSK